MKILKKFVAKKKYSKVKKEYKLNYEEYQAVKKCFDNAEKNYKRFVERKAEFLLLKEGYLKQISEIEAEIKTLKPEQEAEAYVLTKKLEKAQESDKICDIEIEICDEWITRYHDDMYRYQLQLKSLTEQKLKLSYKDVLASQENLKELNVKVEDEVEKDLNF